MKAASDNTFLGSTMSLLLVMQVEDLPVPLALTWRTGYNRKPCLSLQVPEQDWRTWVGQLRHAELDHDSDNEGSIHLHAEGALALSPATWVHLVTVTELPAPEPIDAKRPLGRPEWLDVIQ